MFAQQVINRLQNYSALTIKRILCWGTCFALVLSSSPTLPAVIGKANEKSKIHLTQGVPGRNLPNLDNARHMTSTIPKMLSQVSITKPSVQKNNIAVDLLSSMFSTSFMGGGAAGSTVVAISNWFDSNDGTVKKQEPVKTIPSATKNAQPVSSSVANVQDDSWEMALFDPKNRVGTGGEDLLSRNFNWGLPILSLPGRAGMNLNLDLAYNSLVWAKAGGNIHFDLDKGNPSPGFHLGLPELGTAFLNTEANIGSMLVTMPSGQRFEFRRNSSLGTNKYEEQTGTNMLLDIITGLTGYKSNTWKILTPDGTTYTFKVITSSPKCTEIKDRNGNYISIAYTTTEKISTITDTLGRIVNFNYDSNNLLTSITQNWSGVTHTWATFSYETMTIAAAYLSLNMIGSQNGQSISVLSRVGLADGSVYAYEYNTYAQVHTIRRYAPNSPNPSNFPGDYTQLSYITYDLPRDAMGEQTDCPRFGSRTDWAKDWNNNNGVTTLFHGDFNSNGTVTTPDGVIYKEWFGASGWQRGLTIKTETWHAGVKKKWTEAIWENGNASALYQINPRVIETNIYDDQGNRKKSTMTYTDYNSVSDIKEYSNATDVYRHTHIDYERGIAYIDNKNRRMTGLVKSQTVSDASGTPFSKITYEYDLGGEYLVHQGPPIRHDSTKFGAGFIQGRGNVNVVRRWDAIDSSNIGKTLINKIAYNTSGSTIYTEDGIGHRNSFRYDDSFSDSQNRNTYAYLTEVKDADGYASTTKFIFDFGAITRTQNPKGAATVNTFDAHGRLERVTNEVNQAYTRYVYAPNQLSVQAYTTINDLNSEFYSINIVDGHGRVRAVASEHPNSIGGMRGQYFEYNNLGQQVSQTNPTEIDVNWNPVGDDAAGFAWRSQQYDWKGRPTIFVNQDGTSNTVSYESCGCTGVNTVTITDEVGRRQKEYYDLFGRLSKSQVLNFDGSVFSTSLNTYNIRGQLLRVFLQEGENGEAQESLKTYDGYGRLGTSKKTIESSPTLYSYNNDGTVDSITDARGATKNYTYNNRKMVTSIAYGVPSGVWTTPNVNFSYDEVGNRTLMIDGAGQATYQYDNLSRMTSETRTFNGLSTTYTIGYEYNLAGKLTKLHEPFLNSLLDQGDLNYGYDKAARLSVVSVNGYKWPSNYQGSNQLINNIKYRAWGGLKEQVYANGYKESVTYNARLQMSHLHFGHPLNGDLDAVNGDLDYYNDGRVKFVSDLLNNASYWVDNQMYLVPRAFDRSYEYDQVGRLSETDTGTDARQKIYQGGMRVMTLDGPYNQSFKYDVFGNLTNRGGYFWSSPNQESIKTYVNNRDTSKTYDAEGNILMDEVNPTDRNLVTEHYYDAENRHVRTKYFDPATQSSIPITHTTDGEGVNVKQTNEITGDISYYITSSVIGRAIVKVWIPASNQTQQYTRSVFLPDGRLIGSSHNNIFFNNVNQPNIFGTIRITFRHPITGTEHWFSPGDGSIYDSESRTYPMRTQELDALGDDVGFSDPLKGSVGSGEEGTPKSSYYNVFGNAGDMGNGCTLDAIDISCSQLATMVNSGAVQAVEYYNDGGKLQKRTYDIENIGVGIITKTTVRNVYGEGVPNIFGGELGGSGNTGPVKEVEMIAIMSGDLVVSGFQQSKKGGGTNPSSTSTFYIHIPRSAGASMYYIRCV